MPGAADSSRAVMLSLSADKSSGHDLLFPERRITLNGDNNNNTVTIGRASKVSSKGFVAALDNAWFDSPVISRKHARFFVRMDDQKIEVTDLGSLHGTFLNGDERVPTDRRRELKDGDTLRFGAPIWRGTEQFVPVTVKVGIQFPNREGSSTFQVPEGSDDDATDDDLSSDSDINMKNANGQGRQVQKSASKSATNAQVIDLTDTSYGRQTRQVIDLSSPCGSPIRIDEDDDEEDRSTRNMYTHEHEDMQSVAEESGVPLVHEDFGNLGEHGLEDEYDTDEYGDSRREPGIQADNNSQIDYPEEYDSHLDDYDDGLDDEDLDELDPIEDTDDMDSEEDYLSDDYSGGIDSPTDHPWDHPLSLDTMEFPEIVPLIESLSGRNITSPHTTTTENVTQSTTSISIDRLLNGDKPQMPVPCPPLEPSQASWETPIIDAPQMLSPTKEVTSVPPVMASAEALGVKTGKVAFFRAREENRMALDAQKAASAMRPTSSVHALCNADEPPNEPSSFSFGPAVGQATKPLEDPFVSISTYDTSATLMPPPFIQPEQVNFESYTPASPRSLLSSPVSLGKEAAACSHRTHLGISDIVDTCQPSAGEGKLKRKADDISESTQEQERWAAKAARVLSPAPSAEEEEQPRPEPEAVQEHAEEPDPMEITEPEPEDVGATPVVAPLVPETSLTPERPVKRARMMRVAERLGYAALGGVTAGAMIVGTLIYTAPTFS